MSKSTEACGLGSAFHSAFRKATNCEQAALIWKLIAVMPNQDWNAVLEYVYDALPENVQEAMDIEALHQARRFPLG